MNPTVTPFFHAATHSYAYVVADPSSAAAAIVDPVLDFEPASARTSTLFADAMLAHVRDRKLELRWVLETHAHADHLSAAGYLCAQTGAALGIGAGIAAVQAHFAKLFGLEAQLAHEPDPFDSRFGDGERIALGALELEVVATPGHTPDGVTYVVGNAAFVGDTVFQPDVGTARCDFPGADAATLYRSIERILALRGARQPIPAFAGMTSGEAEPMRLFHCHDYPPRGREPRARSDAAEQRARNIHLAGRDEAGFVELRTARDRTLPVPALLLPAMQWNLRGGRAPAREANGIAYLKLPLDAI